MVGFRRRGRDKSADIKADVKNGSAQPNGAAPTNPQVQAKPTAQAAPPKAERLNEATARELPKELFDMRDKFLQRFGQVSLMLMGVPRYSSQTIADLQRLVLEPLIRDRIAIANVQKKDAPQSEQNGALAGIALWASVSSEVDAKIREQIAAGVFPVRLSGDEWRSGDKVWLLDVIPPGKKIASAVLANFAQVTGGGQVSIHPVVTKQVDSEVLEKMKALPS